MTSRNPLAANLGPGDFGLKLIASYSRDPEFYSDAHFDVDRVFSSTYNSYRIVCSEFSVASGTGLTDMSLRLIQTNGNINSTSNYFTNNIRKTSGGTIVDQRQNGASWAAIGRVSDDFAGGEPRSFATFVMDIHNPMNPNRFTVWQGTNTNFDFTSYEMTLFSGRFQGGQIFRGFRLSQESGPIGPVNFCKISVYGYADSPVYID